MDDPKLTVSVGKLIESDPGEYIWSSPLLPQIEMGLSELYVQNQKQVIITRLSMPSLEENIPSDILYAFILDTSRRDSPLYVTSLHPPLRLYLSSHDEFRFPHLPPTYIRRGQVWTLMAVPSSLTSLMDPLDVPRFYSASPQLNGVWIASRSFG